MSNPLVLLETTSGDMLLELFPEKCPETVANFLAYVDGEFYKNTIFHRVIRDFMIQGGGFTLRLEEKPGTLPPIANEAAKGISNTRGVIAMARASDPHSAAAQFFINTVDNPDLDFTEESPSGYGYCAFGRVVEGMDVVDAIQKLKTKTQGIHEHVPADSVLITGVSRFDA